METSKTQSSSTVMKILCADEAKDKILCDFFKNYFKWAYAAIKSNRMISLVDVVGITVSGIYSLLDFASIIAPIKELKNGIQFKINRNDLEPKDKWFSELKKSNQ